LHLRRHGYEPRLVSGPPRNVREVSTPLRRRPASDALCSRRAACGTGLRGLCPCLVSHGVSQKSIFFCLGMGYERERVWEPARPDPPLPAYARAARGASRSMARARHGRPACPPCPRVADAALSLGCVIFIGCNINHLRAGELQTLLALAPNLGDEAGRIGYGMGHF
jgi:hypothetical protein